jgi:hypothetical protein
MPLQQFLNQPNHELELFAHIAEALRRNIRTLRDKCYYLQLAEVDGYKRCMVTEILTFATEEELARFRYYERYKWPHVMFRPDGENLVVSFTGFHFSYLSTITVREIRTMLFCEGSGISFTAKPPCSIEEMEGLFRDLKLVVKSSGPKTSA